MNQLCCCLVTQSCLTLCHARNCSLPGSSVHGILQARILEWVVISFSKESSQPRDQTGISCIGRWILYCWATREGSPVNSYMYTYVPSLLGLPRTPSPNPTLPSRATQSCKLRCLCFMQVPISYLFCTCGVYMSILISQFVQPSPSPTGSTCQWAITSQKSGWSALENLQTINAGRDAERRELFCTVGGKVNWHSHYGDQDGHSLTV